MKIWAAIFNSIFALGEKLSIFGYRKQLLSFKVVVEQKIL